MHEKAVVPIPAPDHGHDGAPSAPWMQEQLLSADPDPLSQDPTYENKHVRPGRAGQAYTAGVRLTVRGVRLTVRGGGGGQAYTADCHCNFFLCGKRYGFVFSDWPQRALLCECVHSHRSVLDS